MRPSNKSPGLQASKISCFTPSSKTPPMLLLSIPSTFSSMVWETFSVKDCTEPHKLSTPSYERECSSVTRRRKRALSHCASMSQVALNELSSALFSSQLLNSSGLPPPSLLPSMIPTQTTDELIYNACQRCVKAKSY